MSTTTTKKIEVDWRKYDAYVIHLNQSQEQPVMVESYNFTQDMMVESYKFSKDMLLLLLVSEYFINEDGEEEYGTEEYILIKLDDKGYVRMITFNFDDLEDLNEYLRKHYNIEITEVTNNEA